MIATFIDGNYLNQRRLDAASPLSLIDLVRKLITQYRSTSNHFYDCPGHMPKTASAAKQKRNDKKQKLLNEIGLLPDFNVFLGHLVTRRCKCRVRHEQKQVDVALGVDLAVMAATRQIKTAFLVAGDSDFIPAIVRARQYGVRVHLLHGYEARPEVIKACNHATEMTPTWFQNRLARRSA